MMFLFSSPDFRYFYQYSCNPYYVHQNAQAFIRKKVAESQEAMELIIDFLLDILNMPDDKLDPTHRYAAIHIIGILVPEFNKVMQQLHQYSFRSFRVLDCFLVDNYAK